MALFDYTGQLRSGASFQGTLEAESHEAAERTLATMGVRVSSLRPAKRLAYVAPLSLEDCTFFNEQVAAMAQAGVPLEQGLRQLAADAASRKLKRLLLDVADDLSRGGTLDQVVQRHRGRFPGGYAGVVQAGLETGTLGGTLHALAADLRLRGQVRRALIETAAYPLTVLAFALMIVALLMRVVVPGIEDISREVFTQLDDWNAMLSAPATFSQSAAGRVFSLSHAWPTVELIFAGVLAMLILLFVTAAFPRMQAFREALFGLIPGLSQIQRSGALARFAHVAALCAQRGAPLTEVVRAAGEASGNLGLSRAARRVADKLERGELLEKAAGGERRIPALWTCVVNVSGPRGEMPSALADLARIYETRAQHWISAIRALLAPLLLFLVGGILAAIMITVILALSAGMSGMMGLASF
jgi:general secretion pathway protein F